MAAAIVCVAIGYVLGSFLTADVVARRALGKSAYDVGSRNPGMANIGSVLGVRAAGAVLLGDIAKTLVAAWIAWGLCASGALPGADALAVRVLPGAVGAGFPWSGTAACMLAGLGATLGHDFPAWHGFKGGKGVTTTCTAIIMESPLLGVAAGAVGVVVVLATKQLCFGGVTYPVVFLAAMALAVPAGAGAAGTCIIAGSAVLLALAVAKHGGPCLRAFAGKEPQTDLVGMLKHKKG